MERNKPQVIIKIRGSVSARYRGDYYAPRSIASQEPAPGGLFRDVSGTSYVSRAIARNPPPEEPASGFP